MKFGDDEHDSSKTSPTPLLPRMRTITRSKPVVRADRSVKLVQVCTIRKPASELYAFWDCIENIARVVKEPLAITRLSRAQSHWSVSAPTGDGFWEWDEVFITDEPGRMFAWRSRAGADVPNAGSVRFRPAPDDARTEVVVEIRFEPPGGETGAKLAKRSAEKARRHVAETLRRFKALMDASWMPSRK